MKTMLLLAAALTLSPAAAFAQPSDVAAFGAEARIPFPTRSIRTFRTVGMDTVYFQDRRRLWYRADLVGQCFRLPEAIDIGFDARRSDVLDRHSTLIVRGEACRVHALVRVEGPPERRRRR